MQLALVTVVTPPCASTHPTCRYPRSASGSRPASSAAPAGRPLPNSPRPSGPKSVFAHDCVATAPAPARAHGTTAPTHGNLDATATPRSPVAASNATIEKVTAAPI